MRTTIVIDDSFSRRLKPMGSKKALSRFINHCLEEHFERESREERLRKLEAAYERAAAGGRKVSKEWGAAELEEWSEW